jgi:hypothetical protein
MKIPIAGWFSLVLLLLSALPATAMTPPKPGRYRGLATIVFATADGKSTVKRTIPAFALLQENDTLQVVLAQIPDLPDWGTHQPQGPISVVGTEPTVHLFWQTLIGGQTYGMNGLSTANSLTLSYSGDPTEPGSSHVATFTFTLKLTRSGPLP